MVPWALVMVREGLGTAREVVAAPVAVAIVGVIVLGVVLVVVVVVALRERVEGLEDWEDLYIF